MSRLLIVCVVACLLAGPVSWAQDTPTEPIESGVEEKVKVKLVLIDTLVMDKQGRTVPDLAREDFEVRTGDQPRPADTFDVVCPIGAAADPLVINRAEDVPSPLGPGVQRKLVFAFDYYFLHIPLRSLVMDAAKAMIRLAKTPEEEIMIVALADGLRVEQRFTSDKNLLINTLRRMEHDVTLWAREFETGTTGKNYFQDLTTLMDIVGGYDGPKAVVYFSQLTTVGQVGGQRDLWINDVAMHSTAARAPIYPAYASGLQYGSSAAVSELLARFANQSGGRLGGYTSDLSLAYRKAQRDLSCRYTLGVYVDPEQGRQRKEIRVSLKESGHELRYPEMMKLFTDEQKQASRSRAAFIDPGPYENPLVRTFVFPSHPAKSGAWDTLVTLSLPMPVSADGAELNVAAIMKRGTRRVDKFNKQFHIDPPEDGGDTRPVTIFGDSKLKSGAHSLTVVISEAGGKDVVSASSEFTVPDVLKDTLILRGPILARVVPGGLLIQADDEEPPDTKLDAIIGKHSGLEPLLVHEIASSDEMLIFWNACIFGKSKLKSDAVVNRRFLTKDGEVIHAPEAIPLDLETGEKNLHCHEMMEHFPSDTLAAGEYRYEMTITYANSGDLLARGTVPVLVH